MTNTNNWQPGAVIYQIYPRSLMDTTGNGVGDLQGIISKIDYIADLGVDAIWISPFFSSPMKDFGYDISNYRTVDPLFGDIADFDKILEKAHKKNLKVMIDQVLSHTSDQHDWFKESRRNLNNPKADWYVWADAKADGSPPNNWLSIFGGTAWQWDAQRRQYYLHNFLASQPDLNFHNPQVRKQMLKELEFWLKKGVDGVRLDAINYCFHDKLLRDNPAKPEGERQGQGFSADNPYAFQMHTYNSTQPENIGFLEEIRSLLDQYPGTLALGEVASDDSLATMAEYTRGNNRLHTAYSFALLADECSAAHIKKTVTSTVDRMNGSWPCWAFSNHDVKRVMSRWGGDKPSDDFAKMLIALLASLRGYICTYQGEELGLTEADISFEQVQDPFGKAFWPEFKGRDGCRTPIPWSEEKSNAGFTHGTPWLPISTEHQQRSVTRQQAEKDSTLNFYRTFIHWRRQQPALLCGTINFFECPSTTILLVREHQQEKIIACFNLSEKPIKIDLSQTVKNKQIQPMQGYGVTSPEINDKMVSLPGFGMFFGKA